MAGTTEDDRIAAGLATLDARAWAQLLRTLRRRRDVSEGTDGRIAELLALPTSTLADGPVRRELARLVAGERAVIDALLADPALPAAVSELIGTGSGTPSATAPDPSVTDAASTEDDPDAAGSRSAERLRTLRRELDEARRQRDGAEARAGSAEARAVEAGSSRATLEQQVAVLEAALAEAREEVTQAVARAERRAAARIEDLERALAAERSSLEELRRERDRDRSALEALRTELEGLRTRPTVGSVRPAASGRPLVLPDELDPDTTEAARWLLAGASTLLVDGYNVSLGLQPGRPLVDQRRWLVERLRPIAARGGAVPVVVFDGDGQGSMQRDRSGVEIRFTASGTTADDEIVFAVAATADPVLVITDDGELQRRVRAEGGNVLGTVHLLGAIDA